MELLACKLLPLLLLSSVFIISLLNMTAFCEGAGRATNLGMINHINYAKSGEKDIEFGRQTSPVEYPPAYYDPYGSMYYLPAANSEVAAAAAGEDGRLKGGLLFNGGNYGGGAGAGPSSYGGYGYGYGYGVPPYQGIFGLFPRGLLGFPRGLFGLPRGILGLPRIFFGYPVLPGGGYGGGGYGGGLPGPGSKPGGGGGGGYGARAHEVKKSKEEVNPAVP